MVFYIKNATYVQLLKFQAIDPQVHVLLQSPHLMLQQNEEFLSHIKHELLHRHYIDQQLNLAAITKQYIIHQHII